MSAGHGKDTAVRRRFDAPPNGTRHISELLLRAPAWRGKYLR